MKPAKTKKSMFRKSSEILIVAGLVICAFIGVVSIRQALLFGAVIIWGVVNALYYGRQWISALFAKFAADSEDEKKETKFSVPSLYEEDPLRKLVRHVNHRITEKMQSCFPGSSWDWDVKPNINFLMQGGVGRIKLMNAKSFNYAEVCLDERETLSFKFITAVDYADVAKATTGNEEVASNIAPEIAAWFENVGGKVIDDTIADLNSRGIRTLNIKPGGELAIVSDGKDVVQGKVENMPDQSVWSKLVSYLIEERQLGASLQDGCIVLNW